MNDISQNNLAAFDLPALDLTRFSDSLTTSVVGEKYLVFFLGEKFYGVQSKMVAEAAAALPITKLPNSPAWLHGLANLRGEIISVLNLRVLLRKEVVTRPPKPKFIVLRSRVFESGVAFTANRISEIVFLPETEIKRQNDVNSPYVFGHAIYKSQPLELLNVESLLAALRR